MGFHLVGADATVTSWGSANFYSVLLSRISPHTANVTVTTDDHDITALNAGVRGTLPGLYRSRVSLRSRWNSTPRLGNVGFASWGSGSMYTTHVKSWEWTARSANVHDITDYNSSTSSAPKFRSFRPDYLVISGQYTAVADSATPTTGPDIFSSTLQTLTLRYGDEVTDDTIAGAAMVTQHAQTIQVGSLSEAVYSFVSSAAWTPAGTTSALGTAALGVPTWSAGGAAVGAMTLTLATSRTIAIADTFYESITIRCEVGSPVEIEVEVVGTGAVSYDGASL